MTAGSERKGSCECPLQHLRPRKREQDNTIEHQLDGPQGAWLQSCHRPGHFHMRDVHHIGIIVRSIRTGQMQAHLRIIAAAPDSHLPAVAVAYRVCDAHGHIVPARLQHRPKHGPTLRQRTLLLHYPQVKSNRTCVVCYLDSTFG